MARIDVRISNKRFEEIMDRVKEQGGSVKEFIVESVIFRENYLKLNRQEISPQLDVSLYAEQPILQQKDKQESKDNQEDVNTLEEINKPSKEEISKLIDEPIDDIGDNEEFEEEDFDVDDMIEE